MKALHITILAVVVAFAALGDSLGNMACGKTVDKTEHGEGFDILPRPVRAVRTGGTMTLKAQSDIGWTHDAALAKEGYRLKVSAAGVEAAFADDAGRLYALQTLRQLSGDTCRNALVLTCPAVLPCCEIEDAPRFGWRGVHLDEARHFFGKEVVKRLMDLMAQFKLNVFHWHLTDSQSWGLEIPAYPELTAAGHGREMGEAIGPFHYTANDIRDILDYAKVRHISIMPEIDFPGHFASVTRAYPQFGCMGSHVMCVGNPDAVKFVEDALDYVCGLFPEMPVHIGGDECTRKYWEQCPKCRELMKREGLKDVEEIQIWLSHRMAKHLAERGRVEIGWDEIAVGPRLFRERNADAEKLVLPPDGAIVMCRWGDVSAKLANLGRKVVYCDHLGTYFDYSQDLEDDPYEYFGEARNPLSRVYQVDPLKDVCPSARQNVLGGECCNWTEKTLNRYDLDWKLWPRTLALSEVLWTYPDPLKRDFAEFRSRAAAMRRRLIASGVNCAPLE